MFTNSTLSRAAAVAGSLLLVATSASATRPEKPVAAKPGAVAAPATTAETQRYCVTDTITGSRVPIKTCKTRAQWLQEGFDPLNP